MLSSRSCSCLSSRLRSKSDWGLSGLGLGFRLSGLGLGFRVNKGLGFRVSKV